MSTPSHPPSLRLSIHPCWVFEYGGDVESSACDLRVTEGNWTRRDGLYVNTIDADSLKGDAENREGRREGKCSFLPSLARVPASNVHISTNTYQREHTHQQQFSEHDVTRTQRPQTSASRRVCKFT